jgi:hypothetical protein
MSFANKHIAEKHTEKTRKFDLRLTPNVTKYMTSIVARKEQRVRDVCKPFTSKPEIKSRWFERND